MRTGKEKKFKMPSKCPVCDTKVMRKEGEVNHFCENPDCYAKQSRGIGHFISKKAFNIDGLGPKIIEQLIETGLIDDAADLSHLDYVELHELR